MAHPTEQEQLTTDQRVGYYLDLWKKSVDVQQHFNDIEFRIRGLALTVATFALGAGAVAAKDAAAIGPVSLGAAISVLGLFLWQAFYFVDRYWYHPLLKAAVAHGTKFEQELSSELESAGMTDAITKASPVKPQGFFTFFVPRTKRRLRKPLHSDDKIAVFYRIGTFVFIIAAIGLELGTLLTEPRAGSDPIRVQILNDLPSVAPTDPTGGG